MFAGRTYIDSRNLTFTWNLLTVVKDENGGCLWAFANEEVGCFWAFADEDEGFLGEADFVEVEMVGYVELEEVGFEVADSVELD